MKRTFTTTDGERFTLQGRSGDWLHVPSSLVFWQQEQWHVLGHGPPHDRLTDALDKYAPAMRKAEAGARQWFRPEDKRPPSCHEVLTIDAVGKGRIRVAWMYHGEWWTDFGLDRERIDPPQWWQPIVLPGVEDGT